MKAAIRVGKIFLLLCGLGEPKIKYSLKELSLNNGTSFPSPGKNTALHLAARMGDKSAVEELLNRNTSLLTEKNIKGNTPLHLAARIGHFDVVEFLICHAEKLDVENGGVYEVISMRNMKDDTPLHEAVRGGHRSVTSLLVKKVVEANHSDLLASRNKAGESPFSMAIDLNYFEGIVRTFLDAEPSCLLHRGPNNQTPLHRAVFRADLDLDTVKILLEKKPGLIYEKDSYGRTPLHYAAASSRFFGWKVCGHLLKRDSSIALLQDHYQATPAHLAVECGRKQALITILNACPHSVELLNQHRQNILHVAAQNGSVIMVKCILSLPEADDLINEPDKDGNTPLHLAAMNFHSSVVRRLALTRKVDIRAINNDGKTALDVAQDYKRNMTTKKSFIKAFLLQEDNFENWSIQMKTLLDSKSVWEVTKKGSQVPEDECKPSQTQRDYISDASKKDKQALSFIYQAIDENTFEKISRANTAKEAWEIQEDGSYKTADKSLLQDRAMDTSSNEKDGDKIKENQVNCVVRIHFFVFYS
ncbi:hypothetical protein PVL29_025600 [Vitis rotundifolia]|uniref:Uncharacterized protein n=1 Tax=Vitis rotundifolia TaxID=103349 RepID=A0AA39D5N0_VITRO|nr:hypothetical protein PVL29_025600 [Vitis rotundifolia]